MKAHPRFKITEDNKIVAVAVNCHYDYRVTIGDFKKLVELDLVAIKDSEIDLVIESLKEDPFKENPFIENSLINRYSSIQEVIDGISKRTEEINSDKIDKRFNWGDHIPIVCSKCGKRYHTKNITRIGARSVFLEHPWEDDCNCDFSEIRILNDEEYEAYMQAEK